jgi:ureidoacrylate peracid hydrolase
MHKIAIPQSLVDRVIARRGRKHVYDDLDPARTALLVVDMQNAFAMPGIAHSPCPEALEIVPNINRLAQAVRETGGAVVWIRHAYTDEAKTNWSVAYGLSNPKQNAWRTKSLSPDGIGYQLLEMLDARPDDIFVEKKRYSAFIQGSSNVAEVLRARDIDTILVTGTVTNVCCESTARDAMMCNFKTVMVSDANAAQSDDEHNASLATFYLIFGDVMSTDILIACLANNAKKTVAAQ